MPSSPDEPTREYRQRIQIRRIQLAALHTRLQRISLVRLLVFAIIAGSIWLAVHGQSPVGIIAIPVAVFIALIWLQSRIERDAERAIRAVAFYERGIARMEHRWQGGGETGERFIDPHHPYSGDLDIFGRGSLFELLSTARTRAGEAKLADWLRSAATLPELKERHAAIEELRPLLDMRERLAVLSGDFRSDVNPEHLAAWGKAPVNPFGALRPIALALSAVMALALIWWVSTAFVGIAATRAVAGLGAMAGALGLLQRRRVLEIAGATGEPAHDLDLLAHILALLEEQSFASAKLAALQSAIRTTSGLPASARIARIRRLMELLDSRDNVFVRIIGPPLLWTTQIAMAIEDWRATNGSLVPVWLDAVAEIEALSSLACYAWEHPVDVLPNLVECDPVFDAEDIGHPLLPETRSVRNSVHLVQPVRLLVVSGSNMSGKSTLLRAIGANAVLALSGGPVRARSLTMSVFAVGASIRTMDSLEEGQSRFMAEVLRLKQISELPEPVLFLLDELLHGTNSHDRAIGAEGIVRTLLRQGATGLVTTHDLSLAAVADQLAPGAMNVHFEDRLEEGRLVFDYKLRPGVVARSNALDLMRAVGLNV